MLRLIVTELIEETTVEELDTLNINVMAQPGVVEEGDESVEELDDHEERHLPGLQWHQEWREQDPVELVDQVTWNMNKINENLFH